MYKVISKKKKLFLGTKGATL